MLVDGEQFLKVYQVIRDTFVFTNKGLILVDRRTLEGVVVRRTTVLLS